MNVQRKAPVPACVIPLLLLVSLLTASSAAFAQIASFHYELTDPGLVSAAVYDADGRLIRELQRGESQTAGRHALSWDGLDRQGDPVPAGTYQWRVLRTPGFKAEYVLNLGTRPTSAPYHTWAGNHSGACTVAVDESGMYVAAAVTETAGVILKQSMDGEQRLWTRGRTEVTDGRFQGGVSATSDGRGNVYMLQQNGLIQLMDADTGELRVDVIGRDAYRGALGSSARFGRDRPERTWDPLPDQIKQQIDERHEVRFLYRHGEQIAGADIAAHGDVFVISFRDQNSLRWLDKTDGSVDTAIRVEAPLGVAVAPDGRVFVISGKHVLRVDRGGEKQPVVQGLVNPVRLSYDPVHDDLLIVESDPDHRIKRYSLDGELQAAYGREGGREQGTYKPQNFIGVTDIAADLEGGFIIAEEKPAPRRVARFDADGRLVEEWYGGQPYYAWGEPDPQNPRRVWFNPGAWLTLAELDPDRNTWRVLENYRQNELGDGLVKPVSGHRGRWHALRHGDRSYLVSEGVPQVLVHEPGTLRALSVVGKDTERLARAVASADGPEEARAFRWIDGNGDGRPQAGEFTFADAGVVPNGRTVAANFEAVGMASGVDSEGRAYVRATRTAPRWTDGVPVYPFGEEPGINEVVGEVFVASPVTTGGTRGASAYRDRAGNYYACYNTGNDRHGTRWPTEWGGRSRLVKWDAHGEVRFKVGRHAIHGGLGKRPHTTPPGRFHVPAAIIADLRDNVVVTDRVESMGMVWTDDGLYAGDVLDGRVDDGLPDPLYYWWRTPEGEEAIVTSDNATGGAIVQDDQGAVWFFTQGRNSIPVYRIHGWDGWTRLDGRIEIDRTSPHAHATGTGLRATYFNQPQITDSPAATRVDRQVWHGIPRKQEGHHSVMDGFRGGPTYDWSEKVEPLAIDAGAGFAVRWTGELEAPLTEPFIFSVYHRGGVRLWIDGELRIDAWKARQGRSETEPLDLEAGRRYTVRLEYRSTGEHPGCSLNWESLTIDRRRLPGRYLYPAQP